MRAGRIEQAGPPEDLYANPASEFVAGFVGSANRLTATVVDPGSGLTTWGNWPLSVLRLNGHKPNDRITVIVRPELVMIDRLDETNGVKPMRPHGTITQRTFLGSSYRFTLATEAGEITAELHREGAALRRGDQVHIDFAPDSLIAIPYTANTSGRSPSEVPPATTA